MAGALQNKSACAPAGCRSVPEAGVLTVVQPVLVERAGGHRLGGAETVHSEATAAEQPREGQSADRGVREGLAEQVGQTRVVGERVAPASEHGR